MLLMIFTVMWPSTTTQTLTLRTLQMQEGPYSSVEGAAAIASPAVLPSSADEATLVGFSDRVALRALQPQRPPPTTGMLSSQRAAATAAHGAPWPPRASAVEMAPGPTSSLAAP